MGIWAMLKRKKIKTSKQVWTGTLSESITSSKIYQMKFMFDWGSGCCIWTTNAAARKRFGDYPVFTDQLPISPQLKATLERLIDKHDEALDWDYPPNKLLWSEEQVAAFQTEAIAAYQQLCIELGEDYEVFLWPNIIS